MLGCVHLWCNINWHGPCGGTGADPPQTSVSGYKMIHLQVQSTKQLLKEFWLILWSQSCCALQKTFSDSQKRRQAMLQWGQKKKNPPQTILTLSLEDLRDSSSCSRVSVPHVLECGCNVVESSRIIMGRLFFETYSQVVWQLWLRLWMYSFEDACTQKPGSFDSVSALFHSLTQCGSFCTFQITRK